MKESAERVNVFERQLLDLARGQSDALSASPSVRRRCHCAQCAAWYWHWLALTVSGTPAGMDAAKFHKVNEKIDLNDNKLREWVHSQRCVVELPLQAVKCHGLPTTALQSHREFMPHDVHPTARTQPSQYPAVCSSQAAGRMEGVLPCFLTDRLSGSCGVGFRSSSVSCAGQP